MSERKTALFGGTFDPIHIGHTTIVERAAEIIGAEKVIFVPAKRSPLKEAWPVASDEDRLEMIRLVIADLSAPRAADVADNPRFEVSDYELQKASPSFTIDTVRFFKSSLGSDAEIYWLMGADNIDELANWYKITDLIDECNLAVMYRAGFGKPDFSRFKKIWGAERVEKLQRNIIETPLIDISGTEIRRKLAAGEGIFGLLHPAVAEFICEHRLYK